MDGASCGSCQRTGPQFKILKPGRRFVNAANRLSENREGERGTVPGDLERDSPWRFLDRLEGGGSRYPRGLDDGKPSDWTVVSISHENAHDFSIRVKLRGPLTALGRVEFPVEVSPKTFACAQLPVWRLPLSAGRRPGPVRVGDAPSDSQREKPIRKPEGERDSPHFALRTAQKGDSAWRFSDGL